MAYQLQYSVHNVHLYTCRVDATVYCGRLDEKVSETVLCELFLQGLVKWVSVRCHIDV